MTRTAVITGGAGGLGRALSARLRADQWFTVVIDLPGPELEAMANEEGVATYACDLTDSAALQETCAKILADRPSIDMVIYNAGVSQIGAFDETPMENHRKVFEINYFAAVECARFFLPAIRAARGTHLAISSVAGFAPLFHRTAYAASKHALEGFFKSLRAEEEPHAVTVCIAAPSFVATNIGRDEVSDHGTVRPGSAADGIDYMGADEAAEIILAGVRKGRDFVTVGRIAKLAYLLNRFSPRLYHRQMTRRIGGRDTSVSD